MFSRWVPHLTIKAVLYFNTYILAFIGVQLALVIFSIRADVNLRSAYRSDAPHLRVDPCTIPSRNHEWIYDSLTHILSATSQLHQNPTTAQLFHADDFVKDCMNAIEGKGWCTLEEESGDGDGDNKAIQRHVTTDTKHLVPV